MAYHDRAMSRLTLLLLLSWSLPGLLACSAPIVGSWQMQQCDPPEKSEMVIADTDDGDAMIRMGTTTGECLKLIYELEWYEVGSGYEVELHCQQGDCDRFIENSRFAMYCKFRDETESQIACNGRTGAFLDHDLYWTRAD